MALDEAQAFVYEQVGERSLQLAQLTIYFEPGIDRLVTSVAKAEEEVETLASRMEFVACSEVPLAGEHRGVTEAFQQFGPRDRRRREPDVGFFTRVDPIGDSQLAWVAAGHESCTRRRAYRSDCERIAEHGTASRQAVEIGCFDLAVAVGSEGPLRLIVGVEENNVGTRVRTGFCGFILPAGKAPRREQDVQRGKHTQTKTDRPVSSICHLAWNQHWP